MKGGSESGQPPYVGIERPNCNLFSTCIGLGEARTTRGDPETPLSGSQKCPEENVERLGARIGVLAIAVCVVVFIIGLLIGTKEPVFFCAHSQHFPGKVTCAAKRSRLHIPLPSLSLQLLVK